MLVIFDRSHQEQLRMTFKDQVSSELTPQKFQRDFLLSLQVSFVKTILLLSLFRILLF